MATCSCCCDQVECLGGIEADGDETIDGEDNPASFSESRVKCRPVDDEDQIKNQCQDTKSQQHKRLPFKNTGYYKFLQILYQDVKKAQVFFALRLSRRQTCRLDRSDNRCDDVY